MKLDMAKDFLLCQEMNLGSVPLAFPDHPERRDFHAVLFFHQAICHGTMVEFHEILFAITVDGQLEPFRQAVDTAYANAVQPAGYLVAVLVKLAASMQYRHDDLGSRALGFKLVVKLDADRDAAAIVGNRDRVVGVDNNLDVIAMPSQRFVNGIVHHLKYHMVQAGAVRGVADVHARTFAYRLQPFKLLDA